MTDKLQRLVFTGPLFIIGMPRSGTKLVRSLLNIHSRIRIADIETEFLPFWLVHWKQYGDLSIFSNFTRFYHSVTKAPYFSYMKERNKLIDADTWFSRCESFTAQGVFEALLRHDVDAEKESLMIYGDKSPLYIWDINLIKKHFPQALFIHVIRDVRDYCISIEKAWGKNMIRAAQRWVDGVTAARKSAQTIADDYLEIKYEALLDSPEQELMRICSFIGVKFENQMLILSKPTENLGDAKGEIGILKGNHGKYQEQLAPHIRNKIEAISAETLRMLGYHVNYEGPAVRVPNMRLRMYQLCDGANLVKSHLQKRGLIGALTFHYQHFRHSIRKN